MEGEVVKNPKRAGRKRNEESELKVPKSFKFYPRLCELLATEADKCGQTETALVEEAIVREMQRRGYVIAQNGYMISKVKRKGVGDGV